MTAETSRFIDNFIRSCTEAAKKAEENQKKFTEANRPTADFMISKMYSGHSYYNSPYETSNSCGNCDGAKCDWCKPRYCIEERDDLNILGREQFILDDYQAAIDMLRCLETKAENFGYNVTRTTDSYLEKYIK